LSFSALWYRQRRKHTRLRPYGGYANWLTALRLGLVLAAAAFMTALSGPWLWILLAANVVIDVGDGYVARHWDQVSAFGAVFDREVDAVFVLIVYLYFFVAHDFAVWILAPGLLPYAYRLAASARRHRPVPEQRERVAPLLAGANYVVLLIAVAAPTELQLPVLLLSTAIVMASFLGSFLSLYRNEYSLS
jgi:phosphatidylglycerophosphate synthase